MDFAMGFPRSRQGHDVIWVIMDRLTKSAHFLSIRQTDLVDKLAQVFVKEIVRLHGVPKVIVSDRDERTPLTLTEVEDRQVMSLTFVDETVMKINLIKERLKAAQDRQQKYYNQKHRFVEFQVGDFVYVKVSPMKGVSRFSRMSKLSPMYVGPFEIIERIEKSAYRLLLSDQLADVHNVFHVSSLRKGISDSEKKLSANEVEIQENLQYIEESEKILAYDVRKLKSKQIPMVKVQWMHRTAREATWEKESDMRQLYPYLF
ncbi:uncharacterized protein LOC114580822 [Dendrobium catenatum]|uniref:uncharacterized protein LOC114580822 n=1 Tax=Dendrobium catenatum TaxID=906689 RepID=UPI0010A084C3|nr:uncharacterized protein LOC114580822 [Dendrobium catenatum]